MNSKSNLIGIMQGRLSPSQDGRIQFFPNNWQAEFNIAKELGFDFIEWFVDYREDGPNSVGLWKDDAIKNQIEEAYEILPVVSADCGRLGLTGKNFSEKLLKDFISLSSSAIKTFSLHIAEEASIKSDSARKEALQNIKILLDYADKFDIRLALESDLNAGELSDFLNKVDSPRVGVTYDIGNCTSYGFDCPAEIRMLGDRIFGVHIKDRKIGNDQSVFLGTGDADFDSCFKALKDIGYKGNFILQAWRGDDYLNDAKRQFEFARNKLAKI